MHHRVLQRQLRKLGLDPALMPAGEAAWHSLLDRVSRAYADADQDRYLLERSLAISSREMQALYNDLQQASESRIAAERDKLRAAKEDLEKGTGLGLSTALGIISGHGGFINVYSEAGRGTCFKVYLPASANAVTYPINGAAASPYQGRGELVLVVDDEPAFRDITQHCLEEHGFRALTACDGVEAFNLYRKFDDEIQAVITDIMMPVMDGHALIRALHRLNPKVKVIAVSGLSTNETLAETTGVAVHAFLSKPYETAQLLTTLNRILNPADTLGVPADL